MRILASNPDTLGDLVLRQPLYRALLAAGHELTLVVRPGVLPLVAYIAPGAKTLVLPYEAYSHDLAQRWNLFADLFSAARSFAPDVLLVAPYQWTLFEERLAEELPAARKFGMSGHLYGGDPYAGAPPASNLRLDVVAEVPQDLLEVEKNAALCAAVLGQPPGPVEPRLAAAPAALDAARQDLARLGLEPGGYWVACVGGTAHVAIKTWQTENWGRVLGEWARRYSRRFLFVGLPEEETAARDVLQAMAAVLGSEEAAARHASLWMGQGSSIDQLLAMTQLSAGYVGHDTGPMHVAAAMGKPTLAVFGGGTWPRFRPAVEPSVALLVGVPCVGCGWWCAFEQPYCIKAVPPDEVLRAVADLEEGRVTGREARVIEPGEALERRMVLEGSRFAQRQVREKADLSRQLEAAHAMRRAEVSSLHEARAREAAEYATGAAARAAEVEHLRGALATAQEEWRRAADAAAERLAAAQQVGAALEARTSELDRLRGDIRGVVRHLEHANGNGAYAPAMPADDRPRMEDDGDDVARLRAAVGRLEGRVRELEPRTARRPLRQVLVDLVVGGRHYRRRPELPLPGVTVVVPVVNALTEDVRATIESVATQHYHDLQFIVVDTSPNESPSAVADFGDRIDRVVRAPAAGIADAIDKGLAAAAGEVLHVIHPGDVLEPGGVLRVAEYFARHRGVQAVYFEDALRSPGSGWKFPAPPQPTAHVYPLLRRPESFRNGVFFRRWAYEALGPVKPELGLAAEWEWWLRLARRFELRRLDGHVRSVRIERDPGEQEPADFARARAVFEATFGIAGRVRCGAIALADRAFDALRRWFPGQALFFPFERGARANPLPDAEAPAFVPGQPLSPVSNRLPDRLLFSTPDTTGGDAGGTGGTAGPRRAVHYVYYDSSTGTALAYPPVALERLSAMYAARHAAPEAKVVPPDPAYESPYAGFRGGVLGRLGLGNLLQRVPCPYWRFRKPQFDDNDVAAVEVLRLLRGLLDANDDSVRLLNVGCFDGAVLDRLKAATRWRTFGAETNADAARAARAKGHVVWEAAPQDLPLALPVGESFRVIFLANTVEHLQDPLRVLRRLRQLLEPGGLLVLNQPNLDSAHATLFGPTWGHWQLPYHRTLTGRRGLRRLAALADMTVVRVRTRTHPYPTCVSVQLNDLGLGAIVPDTARFSDDVAARGMRLAGWSRLLWDWRGRGDSLYAVLKAL